MARKPKKGRKQDLLKAVDMLKVLSHPLRLAILCDLMEADEMTAGEIVEAEAGLYSQSQISQYLGILRDMGYVEARKEGQAVWYRIKSEDVRMVIETMHGIFCKR